MGRWRPPPPPCRCRRPPPLKAAKDFRHSSVAPPQGATTPSKVDGSALFGIDVRPAELEGGTHRALARRGRDDPRARKRCGARRPLVEAGVMNEADVIAWWRMTPGRPMKGMKALAPRWNDGRTPPCNRAAIVARPRGVAANEQARWHQQGQTRMEAAAHTTTHVDAVYHQPFLAHAKLEPMNCTVDWARGRVRDRGRNPGIRIAAVGEARRSGLKLRADQPSQPFSSAEASVGRLEVAASCWRPRIAPACAGPGEGAVESRAAGHPARPLPPPTYVDRLVPRPGCTRPCLLPAAYHRGRRIVAALY